MEKNDVVVQLYERIVRDRQEIWLNNWWVRNALKRSRFIYFEAPFDH